MIGKESAVRIFFAGTLFFTACSPTKYAEFQPRNVLTQSVPLSPVVPPLEQPDGLEDEDQATRSKTAQRLMVKYVPLSPSEISADDVSNLERLCRELKVSDTTQEITEPSVSLTWPLIGRVSQYFNSYHLGIDIVDTKTPIGKPVLAAARGIVVYRQQSDTSYGNHVIVSHKGRILTLYSHLSAINVQLGEEVQDHTIVGEVGDTGHTSGPNLHWGTFLRDEIGCIAANPYLFLP